MPGRRQRPPAERLDFFTRGNDPLVGIGCELPVGIFRGPTYPEAPGRFQYVPYRGPGHIALGLALEGDGAARCWFARRGQRVEFEVTREEYVPGLPGCPLGWFVVVSRVGGMTSG